jgi:hypothetical protein
MPRKEDSATSGKKPRSRPLDAKTNGRSAVTNGAVLLARIDGRSFWARRYRDLQAEPRKLLKSRQSLPTQNQRFFRPALPAHLGDLSEPDR